MSKGSTAPYRSTEQEYEDKNLKVIAVNYIATFFVFDALAVFPSLCTFIFMIGSSQLI